MQELRIPVRRYFVRALETTAGAHSYSQARLQDDMVRRLEPLPSSGPVVDQVRSFYENAAIDTRHMEFSLEQLDQLRASISWQPVLNETLLSLGRRALERLFASDSAASQGLRPRDCDAFVVVASAFNGFPGLGRRLLEPLGFRPDTLCYDVSNMACAGANHGIHLAHMLLETQQCKSVCILCVDTLGTYSLLQKFTELPSGSEIVSRTVSSDGSAALILSSEPGPRTVFSYASCEHRVHAWSGALDYMVTSTSPNGEPFSAIGKDIRTRLLQESAGLLTPQVLREPLAIHPGGIALLRELVKAEPCLTATAEVSAETFRANGNLASSTVLWVLANHLRRNSNIEPTLRLLAFGPGVHTTLLAFQDVRRS